MKTHTSSFKEQIKLIGKEIDSRITFGDTVLGKDDLNAVTPSYQGAILKSVMKQLDIDSNVAIPIGTILKYEFGLKVNGEYEYINYGNYVVYSIEKQEDTNSYKIVCYDKLLYSMLDYVKLPITYPISIRDYIGTLSMALGLNFANNNDEFANYNKQIQADLYDGLGYTFRDILDELAQVTASTICLNNNDELEIRYITETGDTIDEEFLKDVNVNFGEKFGAVNTIVLSRSGDSDSVYYPSVLPANPYEIKISDNQIMNGNDRADFLPDIYNKLNGLEFYTNDFVSTGICYYDLCDRYSVKVGDKTYSCVMFNDEVLVTQGLEENIFTELPEQTETDYKHASKDDRMINQVYIIAKKNEAEILAVVNTTKEIQKEINPTKDESGSEIIIEDASDNPLTYLEIEGKSQQKTGFSNLRLYDATNIDLSNKKLIINFNSYTSTEILQTMGIADANGSTNINSMCIVGMCGIDEMLGTGAIMIMGMFGQILSMYGASGEFIGNHFYLVAVEGEDISTAVPLANLNTLEVYNYTFPSNMINLNYILGMTESPSGTYNIPANSLFWDCLLLDIVQEIKPTPQSPIEIKNVGIYDGEKNKYLIKFVKKNKEENEETDFYINDTLKSLSDEIKDIYYIKNNKQYVKRMIGTLIANNVNSVIIDDMLPNGLFMSNVGGTINGNTINFDSTVNEAIIQYELAETYIEELGNIEMPNTFEGYNHITTTDILLPTINLTYVRDTVIADYVENHVAELKLTENEIKESVESVSSSVDGLSTTINRVEEITNDNSQVINVISTNIDKTSGEVREVTTTTGFTFNADGMTIDDGSGFKAEHTANGTYYKDGNSIVGQYTKDGSKQKNLELFGIYSYGKESIDDTSMFIGQLYRDENNEQCFGHFYNGGDY